MQFLLTELQEVPEVKIYGSLDYQRRVGAVSFNVGKHHAHDVATILDASEWPCALDTCVRNH